MSALASVLASDGHAILGSDDFSVSPGQPLSRAFGHRLPRRIRRRACPGRSRRGHYRFQRQTRSRPQSRTRRASRVGRAVVFVRRLSGALHARQRCGSHRRKLREVHSDGDGRVVAARLGRDPGYFIGAVPLDLATTGHAGSDRTFLIEGDEYIVGDDDRRSKFELYHPDRLLITSLVHDHLNVFPTLASYEAPFARADRLACRPTRLLVCAHGPSRPLRRLTAGPPRRLVRPRAVPRLSCRETSRSARSPGSIWSPRAASASPLETELLGPAQYREHRRRRRPAARARPTRRRALQPRRRAGSAASPGAWTRRPAASRVPVYEGFGSSLREGPLGHRRDRCCISRDRRPVVVFEPHTFSWRNAGHCPGTTRCSQAWRGFCCCRRRDTAPQSHQQLSQEHILARIREAGIEATPFRPVRPILAALETQPGRRRGGAPAVLGSAGWLGAHAAANAGSIASGQDRPTKDKCDAGTRPSHPAPPRRLYRWRLDDARPRARRFPVTNPAGGETLADLADCDAADAVARRRSGASAMPAWARSNSQGSRRRDATMVRADHGQRRRISPR